MAAKDDEKKLLEEAKGIEEDLGKTETGTLTRFVKTMNVLVFVGEIAGLCINAACVFIALQMMLSPVKKHIIDHALDRVAYRAFWAVQGSLLLYGSFACGFATLYFGLLNKSISNIPKRFKPNMLFGFFQYELGRAIYLIVAGFYVYTVMSVYTMVAVVPDSLWWFCKIAGSTSLIFGVYMLIFDVCFDFLETPRYHGCCGGRRQDPGSWLDAELAEFKNEIMSTPGGILLAHELPKPGGILLAHEMNKETKAAPKN